MQKETCYVEKKVLIPVRLTEVERKKFKGWCIDNSTSAQKVLENYVKSLIDYKK